MKYGFVYIWFDSKRKMFYIGCHWGTEDDGYICSSTRMRNVYKRRPTDFKRRIINRIHTNRTDLLEEEYKWLSLIPKEQLGKRYYNLRVHHCGHWSSNEQSKQNVINKLKVPKTQEQKDKVSEGLKKYFKYNPHDEEYKKNMSNSLKDRNITWNDKISDSLKGNKNFLGKSHSEETKKKISIKNSNRVFTEEHKQKLRDSHMGQIPWNKGISKSNG